VLKTRMQQVAKRLWVVALITGLAVLAAVVTSAMQRPTYVGKSTLVVSSPGKTTEQDAILVAGYVALFNDPATTARLRTQTKIPDGVTFAARMAAASPIITISATAQNAAVAQDASQDMANAFRNDINAVRQEGNADAVADLTRQLNQLRSQPGPQDALSNPQLGALQDRIDSIKLDSTNQLQDLQLRAGVTSDSPKTVQNVALAAVGGLILGILAALGLAAISTRLTSSADIREKTGVRPLVEIPDPAKSKRNRLNGDRLAKLANLVDLEKSGSPLIVAFTASRGTHGAQDLAFLVGELWAKQGRRTVVVETAPPDGARGFTDALETSHSATHLLQDGSTDGLKILPPGRFVSDRYSLVTPERVAAVFKELASVADVIVIAAPSIADSVEAQLLCAAADCTILVAARGHAKAGDITSAADSLQSARAVLLGAVLVNGKLPGADAAKRRRTGAAATNGRAPDRNRGTKESVTVKPS
jgi:polysaccharide biosynthesis transport protein